MQLKAKQLEWKDNIVPGCGLSESYDNVWGFSILFDDEDTPSEPYRAAWGEGEPESFATVEEAKAWCQEQADGFIDDHGEVVTP